jgi:hypothetical protein
LPPAATFQFSPSISLIEEYTDNYSLTERDKQSNLRSTLAPGGQLLINGAFTRGVIAYTFAPAYDTAVDDFRFFHSLLGQVVWEPTPRWRLTVADAFTRNDEPSEADRLGLRRERRTFTSNRLALLSDYLIGRLATRQAYELSTFADDRGSETVSHTIAASATAPIYATNALTVGYEYLTSDTSTEEAGLDPDRDLSNADIQGHRVSATATRQVTSLTSLGLTTSYAFRTATTESEDTDYQLWNAAVLATHRLPGRLFLNTSLGVSGLRTGSNDMLGPNVSTATEFAYQFARAVASLRLERGYSETFSDGENFGVVLTEGVTGSLFYPFTPGLSGTVQGFYRRNKFTGVTESASRDERTESWGGGLAFSLRLLNRMLLELSYRYLRQTGDSGDTGDVGRAGTGNSYSENQVRAALTVNF